MRLGKLANRFAVFLILSGALALVGTTSARCDDLPPLPGSSPSYKELQDPEYLDKIYKALGLEIRVLNLLDPMTGVPESIRINHNEVFKIIVPSDSTVLDAAEASPAGHLCTNVSVALRWNFQRTSQTVARAQIRNAPSNLPDGMLFESLSHKGERYQAAVFPTGDVLLTKGISGSPSFDFAARHCKISVKTVTALLSKEVQPKINCGNVWVDRRYQAWPPEQSSEIPRCSEVSNSGGGQLTINEYFFEPVEGFIDFSFDAYSIPDRFIIDDGFSLTYVNFSSLFSGKKEFSFYKRRLTTRLRVIVIGSNDATGWQYEMSCLKSFPGLFLLKTKPSSGPVFGGGTLPPTGPIAPATKAIYLSRWDDGKVLTRAAGDALVFLAQGNAKIHGKVMGVEMLGAPPQQASAECSPVKARLIRYFRDMGSTSGPVLSMYQGCLNTWIGTKPTQEWMDITNSFPYHMEVLLEVTYTNGAVSTEPVAWAFLVGAADYEELYPMVPNKNNFKVVEALEFDVKHLPLVRDRIREIQQRYPLSSYDLKAGLIGGLGGRWNCQTLSKEMMHELRQLAVLSDNPPPPTGASCAAQVRFNALLQGEFCRNAGKQNWFTRGCAPCCTTSLNYQTPLINSKFCAQPNDRGWEPDYTKLCNEECNK